MRRKSTSQELQEARALVAAGWCQGPWHVVRDGQDCYCVGGAVLKVLKDQDLFGEARLYRRVYQLLGSPTMNALHRATHRLAPTFGSAFDYNEAPGRTQAEVLALFDAALEEVTK